MLILDSVLRALKKYQIWLLTRILHHITLHKHIFATKLHGKEVRLLAI